MKTHNSINIAASVTDVQVLGPNPNRVALIFTKPGSGQVTLAFGRLPSVSFDVQAISFNPALVLTRDMIGERIQEPLFVTTAASGSFACIEVLNS